MRIISTEERLTLELNFWDAIGLQMLVIAFWFTYCIGAFLWTRELFQSIALITMMTALTGWMFTLMYHVVKKILKEKSNGKK